MALVFKVGLLTLKTAAKPLAKQFERVIMGHPVARQRVISMAQWLHRLEVGISRGAEGRTGRAFVGDMSEEKALELASKVVSEGFLYAVGIGVVGAELYRKNQEDLVKKEKEAAEKEAMRDLHERHLAAERVLREELRTLSGQLHRLDERLQFMEQRMGRRRGWLWG